MEAPELILEQVFCIQYPVKFRKNKETVWPLINFGNEVNAITSAYAVVLGLKVCPTTIGAQKIYSSFLKTFGMVIASFQVKDKLGRDWFFQETFLLANINIEIVFGMLFFTLSNAII